MALIALATEDELSEEIGQRLAEDAGLEVGQRLRRDGSGYLRSRVANFCEMARFQPVVVIADLDRAPCPATLVAEWFRARQRSADLLVRIAVREIESWLLADRQAMGELLGRGVRALPTTPDRLGDPKATLMRLASRAPRGVRQDLLVTRGAIASQGLGYSSRLCAVVRTTWDPGRAALQSPSLRRTRQRLEELSQRLARRADRGTM